MTSSLPYKTKQFFFVLIKLSIVVGAFYFIYNKIVNNNDISFSTFIDFLLKNESFSIKNVAFLILLSVFNWFFEILKWQHLVGFVKKINFKNALEQSLGALTASLITPNRIGDYGAKAIYYSTKYRKRIILINLLSNLLQMSATLIFGAIGFSFFIIEYDPNLNYYKLTRFLVIALLIISLIGFGITKKNFTIKGFSIEKIKKFLYGYPKTKLLLGFMFSIMRYAVFSFQFYFLLRLFDVEISYLNSMIVITSIYLLASIIPSIFVFDVIIKGSIAVYLFAYLGISEFIILSVVTIMWILNFVLPSFFGSYYVLNFNLPKNSDPT
ncbi:MAG: hypothetical protein HKO01_05105 [Flaviramulus sp.]|nr:lysylphosphatidylglycerol synthase domain-containing protein [Flaviramulus sp.]NNC49894.1 hypothetical protein [Flaviramulus sp.]